MHVQECARGRACVSFSEDAQQRPFQEESKMKLLITNEDNSKLQNTYTTHPSLSIGA